MIRHRKAEVDYLREAKAAEPYEWKSAAFEEWRRPFLAQALAAGLNRDAFSDTRLMLSEQFYFTDVQAIPVYGGHQQFADSCKALGQLQVQVEEALTIEIMQRLPVPGTTRRWRISLGYARPLHSGGRSTIFWNGSETKPPKLLCLFGSCANRAGEKCRR